MPRRRRTKPSAARIRKKPRREMCSCVARSLYERRQEREHVAKCFNPREECRQSNGKQLAIGLGEEVRGIVEEGVADDEGEGKEVEVVVLAVRERRGDDVDDGADEGEEREECGQFETIGLVEDAILEEAAEEEDEENAEKAGEKGVERRGDEEVEDEARGVEGEGVEGTAEDENADRLE